MCSSPSHCDFAFASTQPFLLLSSSVLRHPQLDGPSGSSNAARLINPSVLVEEVVFGVVVLAVAVAVFGGVFG